MPVALPRPDDPLRALGWPLVGLFAGGGLLAASESLLVPRLQWALHLGYAQALAVQLVYYAGYLVFAWPAARVLAKVGVLRAIAGALVVMAAGAVLLALAQARLRGDALVTALLLLSVGVTTLQIAGNALVAAAPARFTLLQGFNSLGTVAAPAIAAPLLLGGGGGAAIPFLLLAALFALLAPAFAAAAPLLPAPPPRLLAPLGRPRVQAGAVAIFAYVGAEVTLGAVAAAFLHLPAVLGAAPVQAGRLVSLYWGGAMVGRFAGAWVLRRVAPPRLLALAAIGAAALLLLAAGLAGTTGAAALLAVGLCHSVMFPLVFALAMPDDPAERAGAATLLCMAVVGGAVVPVATGLLADRVGLRAALALPALCYLPILGFALRSRDPAAAS